jgi:sugar lactone lactonase YvrE
MQRLHTTVALDGIIFPEGMRWHERRVWFSDVLAGEIVAFDPASRRRETMASGIALPSGLGFLPDGSVLVTTMHERTLLRCSGGRTELVADLKPLAPRLNDMVTDSAGRSFLDACSDGSTGSLILVTPDGQARVAADGLKEPNGIALSQDERTLVVNDLIDSKIWAFDVGAQGLSNKRLFADLGGADPDGLCLDAEGCAWVGMPQQHAMRRIRPGGEVTHEIAYGPEKWAIAPVLGGPDRRTLYLCTAEIDIETIVRLLDDPTGARAQCRGWIEAAEVDVPGAGRP